jgi:hypothetical protein
VTWADLLQASERAGVQPSDRLEFAFLDADADAAHLKVTRVDGWFSIDVHRRGGDVGGFIIAGAQESQQDAYDKMVARARLPKDMD